MPSRSTARRLRQVGALLMLVIAGVHFQQYVDFMSEVPTVGVLFLLNAAGGTGLVLAMLSGDRLIAFLAMSGSLALAIGSLASIGIALNGSFFGYQEPTLRLPILIAIVAEALLVAVLALPLARNVRIG
jgi:predicted Na+-dependent transporter